MQSNLAFTVNEGWVLIEQILHEYKTDTLLVHLTATLIPRYKRKIHIIFPLVHEITEAIY